MFCSGRVQLQFARLGRRRWLVVHYSVALRRAQSRGLLRKLAATLVTKPRVYETITENTRLAEPLIYL